MKRSISWLINLAWMAVLAGSEMASGPQASAVLADDTKAAGTPAILPRPDFQFCGKVGKTFQDSDPPQFPQPVRAPKGAPNVVIILLDDTGFGQYSAFGGGVPSPTLDKVAAEGLKYCPQPFGFNLLWARELTSESIRALRSTSHTDCHFFSPEGSKRWRSI